MDLSKTAIAVITGIVLFRPAVAQENILASHRDGVVLLKFRDGVPPSVQDAILTKHGATRKKKIGVDVNVIAVGNGRVFDTIQALLKINEILYAEPDYVSSPPDGLAAQQGKRFVPFGFRTGLRPLGILPWMQSTGFVGAVPNDLNFGLQWAHQNTGTTVNGITGTAGADQRTALAWRVTTGTDSVVIAQFDTGVQYSHPDLLTNMWNNPGGVGGCPAGTHGYNVVANSCDPMDDDTFYGGHGSLVAGTMAGIGNNSAGIAGVNWTTSIMAMKITDSNDNSSTSDLITAMDWVIDAKKAGINVRVANDSVTYQGTAFSQALSDEIDLLTSNDILFVTPAGNTAQNNDVIPRYPCSYNRPGEICVGGSDQNDSFWISSCYGLKTVKLAAPAVNNYSTLRQSNYEFLNGTSFSSPEVAGAAALILSIGYLSVTNLKNAILNSVDVLPSLAGVTATGGRLNVCKAIPACASGTSTVPGNVTPPTITSIPQSGSLVGASTGVWSGLPTAYTYQWYRCNISRSGCAAIQGAIAPTYAMLASADTGATLQVTVKATNSLGSTSVQSAISSTIAAVSSPFAINSTITDGQNINGTLQWSATPSQAVNFVQFYVDGVLRQTVVSSPYTYNQGTTRLFDTSTLSTGTHVLGIRALSNDNRTYGFYGATVTVGGGIQNTALPVISGTAAQGQTLTTSNGTWTNNPTSFSYQWQRCSGSSCTSIAGATSSSYVVSSSDVGFTLQVVVTAISSSGSDSATSAPTGVIAGIVSITTSSLPSGQQGTVYPSTSLTASGGGAPYTWSLLSGTLPAGLSLSSAGVISGTPTGSGTSSFTVQVQDSNTQTAAKALSILISPSGGGSGISLVQSSALEGTAVSSLSVAFPAANGVGHLLLAFVRMSSSTQTVTLSDSAGNIYTQAAAQTQSADGHQIRLFYAKNSAAGANTVTATFSATNNHPWLSIYEVSGLSTSNPLDQTASAQGSGTSVSTGATGVTQNANEFVFVGAGFNTPSFKGTVTAASGYTLAQQDTTNSRAANETALVSATGSYTGAFSLNTAANWSALIATFTP